MPLIANRIHVGTWPESMLPPERSLVLGVKLKPNINLHTERIWSALECALLTCFSGRRTALDTCLLCFCRLFGGLVLDIKRKAPWYWSDYRDALSLQCLASFLFLYCACMSPVITFGGLLGEATEGRIVRTLPLLMVPNESENMKAAKSSGRKIPWAWTEEIGFFLLNYIVFWLHANEQHRSPFRTDPLLPAYQFR